MDAGNRMDVDPEVPVREQPETLPRPREDSYHSVRSNLKEERVNSLEQQLVGFSMDDK